MVKRWVNAEGPAPAVREQLSQVVERDDAVAQQAPSLLGMARHHPCGHVIRRHCIWAPGLMLAHIGLRIARSSCAVFAPTGSLAAAEPNAVRITHDHPRGQPRLHRGHPTLLPASRKTATPASVTSRTLATDATACALGGPAREIVGK